MRNPKPTVDTRLFKYVTYHQMRQDATAIVRTDPDLAPHEDILISPDWDDFNELAWICLMKKEVILAWIANQLSSIED